MTSRFAIGALAGTAVLATAASAGVTVTTSQVLWNFRVANGGQSVGTETFNSYSGFDANPITGTLGNTVWTVSAPGGLFADAGMMSTQSAYDTLAFTFSPGVRAVAGNIFGTDTQLNIVPTIVNVTLSDGTSYEGFTTSASDFIGFYSSAANISSLSISVASPTGSGSVHSTIDNLYLAIPAPGAAALLGLAGLATRRRRA